MYASQTDGDLERIRLFHFTLGSPYIYQETQSAKPDKLLNSLLSDDLKHPPQEH